MFFEDDAYHGLPRDPFKACIAPRPIGWISTISARGTANLAPYSFFNAVAEAPRMVMLCVNGDHKAGGLKDTLANVIEIPEFVVNMATWDLKDAMNASCAPLPPDQDEFAAIGLEKFPSRLIRPPMVKAAHVQLECTVHQLVELPPIPSGGRNVMVIGRVLGIHIDDHVMTEGRIDFNKLRPLGRLGYSQYVVAGGDAVFAMRRPD